MPETNQATYIKRLLMPAQAKTTSRRVWSIDLEAVWIPFLTATNTTGDSAIPVDALGCPLRLAYSKDGAVKFNQNGKPTIRVNKDLSNTIRIIRENFTAELLQHTNEVKTAFPDEYANQIQVCREAGKPIFEADSIALKKANAERLEAELKALASQKKEDKQPASQPENNHDKHNRKKDLVNV